MIDDVTKTTYTCIKCLEDKPLGEFNKHRTNKTCRSHSCKVCTGLYNSAYKKQNRSKINEQLRNKLATDPEFKTSYTDRRKKRDTRRSARAREYKYDKVAELLRYHKKEPRRVASAMVRDAVKSGKLTKPRMCSQCSTEGTLHGHHTDYTKPLDVVWLCQSCHLAAHGKQPRKITSSQTPPESTLLFYSTSRSARPSLS